jgi:hypothetical protein
MKGSLTTLNGNAMEQLHFLSVSVALKRADMRNACGLRLRCCGYVTVGRSLALHFAAGIWRNRQESVALNPFNAIGDVH